MPGTDLALIAPKTLEHFGGEQRLDLIRQTVALGTSPEEFALFLAVAENLGLDPLARQIYAIMRWNGRLRREVMTVQVSIDGFRAFADQHPAYAGSDRPVFEWRDGPNGPVLDAAVVTVHKLMPDGRIVDYVGVAYWDEYVDEKSPMWAKMPRTMLAKCAEAQALRKGFPKQLSGVYTNDEMMQADQDADPWRGYRAQLWERWRALPETDGKAAVRAKGIDPRKCDPDQLAVFAADIQPLEDDIPADGELLDEDPVAPAATTPGDAAASPGNISAGAETSSAVTEQEAPPAADRTPSTAPAGPPPTQTEMDRMTRYAADRKRKAEQADQLRSTPTGPATRPPRTVSARADAEAEAENFAGLADAEDHTR